MTDNLRKCSFRGISFYIDSIDLSTGRRLSVNELPYENLPYIEDMGGITEKFTVNGMIVGLTDKPYADIENKILDLRQAFRQSGYAILNIAYFGQKLRVRSGEASFSPQAGTNICKFTCDFYPETLPSPLIPITQYAVLANTYTENLYLKYLRVLRKYITDFATVTGYITNAKYVLRNFSGLLNNFKGYILATFNNIIFTDEDDRKRLKESIDNLNEVDYKPYFSTLYDVVTTEKEGYNANVLDVQLQFIPETIELIGEYSKTKEQDAINRTYLSHAFKQMLIGSYACILTQTQFTSKEQAIYHRAKLSDLLDAEYNYMLEDTDDELLELTNLTATYLTVVIATLSPVITIEGHTEFLPATWWSYRLYGNLDYVDDLIERNNVSDPDFMPLSFKALARTT